jgi:hypothetical protein
LVFAVDGGSGVDVASFADAKQNIWDTIEQLAVNANVT